MFDNRKASSKCINTSTEEGARIAQEVTEKNRAQAIKALEGAKEFIVFVMDEDKGAAVCNITGKAVENAVNMLDHATLELKKHFVINMIKNMAKGGTEDSKV